MLLHWLITGVRFESLIDSCPLGGCKKLPFGLYDWKVVNKVYAYTKYTTLFYQIAFNFQSPLIKAI